MDNNNFNDQQQYGYNGQQPQQPNYQQPPIQKISSGLGIASLICGIIGFLTGMIFIGLVLDIVAVILGIIAIASKKQKSALGIAGMVIGMLGFIIMLFVITVFKGFGDRTIVNSEDVNYSSDFVNQTTTNDETVEEDVLDISDLDIKEYSYENTIGDTLHFLVITNNSDKTICIHSNCTAYDSNSEIIGADSSDLQALGSGCTSILTDYFSDVNNIDHFEYTLTIENDAYYNSIIQDIDMEVTELDDKVVVTCTNTGDVPAKFIEATVLFFENEEVVYYGTIYITDNDSELKPGATLSEQVEIYGETFDRTEVYITGRN